MTVAVAGVAAGAVQEELEFVTPPPGLRDLRRFTLAPLDDVGILFALRATDDPGVRLFVVPPQLYFPDYGPDLDDATLGALGTDGPASASDVVLLVVVHPGNGTEPPTANLLAPIAVHARTGASLQVVLEGDRWPLRAALHAERQAS